MPHFYVSIEALDHKVFKYAGYQSALNADYYKASFEEYGPTGMPNGHPHVGEPCTVLVLDTYIADRINEDLKPYGQQPYQPKQLILTWRDAKGKLWRVMWSQRSSPEEEEKGRAYALENGQMLHAFRVGDNSAWEKAYDQHEEIEEHNSQNSI
jgi:hypothetical protein